MRWVALALAYALFLWMFLSVAAVDAMGDTWVMAGHSGEGERMLTFAADWRHGMNGHSPIYMPGFFALTIASWYWLQKQPLSFLVGGGLIALIAGFALAWIAAPAGRAAASAAFIREFHVAPGTDIGATWAAVPVSAFTAVCWTVFVVACRTAITTGSMRLSALVASLYVVLGFVRHWWTLEHFGKGNDVARWATRVTQGDVVAIGSLLAMLLLAVFLVTTAMDDRPRARKSEGF